MSSRRVVAIAGSLSIPSRTRLVTADVASRIAARSGGVVTLVDVAELASELGQTFSRPAAGRAVEAALRAIEQADLIVAGSPIYKGSYSGFFKHLIDLVDYRALAGVPVALLATGGSDRHALAVEHQMRPLFGSFDAHTLPTAVFVVDRDVGADGQVADDRVAARIETLVREAAGAILRPAAAA
ncbi:NAD(P)H-dependent oxidoreductase [Hansschlegelia zhihuaiae]|uniref:FMN reductase n=1 Tax=Hansschlegelia zhihuaiae TaxID=405005 RepID=A0A4Q0MFH1_9HYPH|nr:NAD(P)H-dependent oxidoreductase [Hansschlegelia zhihuaiae]RXF72034.1 FMN reductase [Hansschlegelia zhihuaiae]